MSVGEHGTLTWELTDGKKQEFGARVICKRESKKRKYLLAFDDGDTPKWSKIDNFSVSSEEARFKLPRPEVIKNCGLSNDQVSRHPAGRAP